MKASHLYVIQLDTIRGILLAMEYDLNFDDNNYNYDCNDSSDNKEKLAHRLYDILTFHGYKTKDYSYVIKDFFPDLYNYDLYGDIHTNSSYNDIKI